jgi:type VI secretion system protein ImpL
MSKLKAITKHKYFIPVLCLFIAALLIFFAGPYFSFAGYTPLDSFLSQLLLWLLIVGVYCLVQYIKYLKSQRNQEKMVEAITEDDGATEAIDAESNELKEKFKQAFATLKKTKGGPGSLADIPWYMIIGSPGSGKTTLLSNSGLRFPLFNESENKAVQGVGGTKNCDWWITQDAVLLDTAGRYASQDSFQKVDKSGWHNFLGMIKRFRKKPISGLLVSFSMSDLMTMNEYELSQLTFQLKQRIAEVNDFFSTRFPVYIVVTKSDMIAGFTQFYETFSHKEREQAFGITFDKSESLDGQLAPAFQMRFEDLVKAVSRRQWPRMSLERDANRKALIYGFSDQFASLKPALMTIIQGLSKADEGMTTAIIRGLYFTSGTQSGAPIDRIIAKVSQAFGLKNIAKVMWNNDQRSYFIKDLLQQVVFVEADQFGTLNRYENQKRLIKRGLMASAAVLTVGLCIGLFISYSNNADYIVRSTLSVDSWTEQYKDKSGDGDIRQYIPALNDFTNDIEGLVERNREQFSGLGLGQSDSLEGALTASYNRLLQTVLLPYVKEQVETHLRQAEDVNRQYQALKTYLMMANLEGRDNEFINRYLADNLNNNQNFSEQEYVQVAAHVQNLVANNMLFDNVNGTIVQQARRTLSAQPLGEIYYKQFADAYLSNPSNYLSMAQLAGTDWRIVLQTQSDDIQTISRLYTPELFKKVLDEDIDNYLDQLDGEAWVLGPENVVNSGKLKEDFEKLYARDYVNNWQGLINDISIKPITNVAALNASLQLLIEVDSPLFALLESISDATKLVADDFALPRINLGARASQAADIARRAATSDSPDLFITTRFTKLHELMATEKKAATQQRLSALLQEINVALSFQMQSGQNEMTSATPSVNNLQGYGYLQVDPLNRWITQLVGSIQSAQSQVKKTQLSSVWSKDVLATCKEVIDFKYPFERGASTDASMRDINQMFAPQGTIYRFFEENLATLVNTQTLPWRWRDNVQTAYGFSSEVLPFFEKVYRIQRSLYASDGSQAQMQLSITPVYLDPRLARFRMSVYGQTFNYQFGRPTATLLTWPPANPGTRNEFSFVRRDGSEVIETAEGLFALFKLINSSETTRVSANKVNVTFSKNDYKAIYELSAASPVDPMVFSDMASLTCIDSL